MGLLRPPSASRSQLEWCQDTAPQARPPAFVPPSNCPLVPPDSPIPPPRPCGQKTLDFCVIRGPASQAEVDQMAPA